MELKTALELVVNPGLALLPEKYRSDDAKIMLLAIGMQESRFKHRVQSGNGPAHGFYQFESIGIKGVLQHSSTKEMVKEVMNLLEITDAYSAVIYNDLLATVFARLNLFTNPKKLPIISDDTEVSWLYYKNTWRPGKPKRETWDNFYITAKDLVLNYK